MAMHVLQSNGTVSRSGLVGAQFKQHTGPQQEDVRQPGEFPAFTDSGIYFDFYVAAKLKLRPTAAGWGSWQTPPALPSCSLSPCSSTLDLGRARRERMLCSEKNEEVQNKSKSRVPAKP